MPVLVVFSGLPATGKTTLARLLVPRIAAAYLRADTIEQTLRRWFVPAPITREGYEVAYAVAEENLKLGMNVVADSVNPLRITRQAWHQVALRSNAICVDIEVVCTDKEEHQRRAQSRKSDIAGLALPEWDAIIARRYESWGTSARIVADTCAMSAEESVEFILQSMWKNGFSSAAYPPR